MMHEMVRRGMDMALESPTMGHLMRRSSRMVSGRELDLLKMGLSQRTIIRTAKQAFAKHGLRVHLVDPYGTSSACPVCGGPFRVADCRTDRRLWRQWRRKECIIRLYLVDRMARRQSTC